MENTIQKKRIDRELAIKIAHLAYAILIIALAVAVGVLFIVSCVDIYNSQEISPFTTVAIESHFRAIAVPVIAFPCLVVVGFVLHFVFPLEKKEKKVENDKAYDTLQKKVDLGKVSATSFSQIVRERYLRLGTTIGSLLIWIAALVIILVFALNPENYAGGTEVNASVKDITLVVFVSALIAMGMSVVANFSNKLSKKRELNLLKLCVKENKEVMGVASSYYHVKILDKAFALYDQIKTFIGKYEELSIWVARGVVGVLAIVFIVLGALNGGVADVLGKAIRICTECIGLG